MKKLGFVLAAAFCLALAGSSVSAQTTYTWNQTGSAAWTTSTNWTPTRTTPAADDVLVFNNGATTTATAIPSQTLGQLSVSGNTTVNLQAAAASTLLTIAGGTGTDLSVAAGSQLNVNVATNTLALTVGTGATGSISGSMTYTLAAHTLIAADASGITFNSGATFTQGTGTTGNVFGSGTANSVVFASGSTFIQLAGSNPFQKTQPASVVVFQTGSLFSLQANLTPSFSGRTYGNFELNSSGATPTVTGTAAVSIDNLTITQGTLNFNMTGTPGHSIKGNISVAGTLNFAPASAGTVNLNGASAQTISGAGTITLNSANQTVVINNANGITLSRSLTFTLGTLSFTSGIITTGANTLAIGSGAALSGASPTTYVNGNLRKTYAATGVKGFEVGTANGYSPVSVNITAGTFPTDFDVKAVQGPQPNIKTPGGALQRYWKLAATGVTANLNFNYLDIDIPAPASTENTFVIFKWDGSFSQPGGSVDTATNQASISGVSDATLLSDWTLAQPNAPTAANGLVSGHVLDNAGKPVAGALVYLSGTQNRKFITDANGNYRFDKVETNGFYTVTPMRANYVFSPGARSFSQLGNNTEATFTATLANGYVNPLNMPEYFVRQHYLDFLGREPDEAGFNFWSDQILECGNDAACIDRRTVNVSAAYFLSVEFQQTGGLVDRLYQASYGRSPRYAEFMPDTAGIAREVVVGRTGWEGQLAANKEAFLASWMERPAFHSVYDTLSNDAYVDTLFRNTGASYSPSERGSLVSGLDAGTLSRVDVLEQIANNPGFAKARFNEAFVLMEYFGYLRRDPDDAGFHFWLDKLNQFDGNFERADMVKAFISSGEYRARFGR